ncbi:CD3337/EF1877 family mobilome membrane protein [Faecalimonas sp.]
MTICQKSKKRIRICLFVFLAILTFVLLTGIVANAEGILPSEVVKDAKLLYQKYPLLNYELDFKYYTSDGIGGIVGDTVDAPINATLFAVLSMLWFFSLGIYQIGAFLIGQAYEFDFLSKVIGKLGKSISKLLGITKNGFAKEGFFPSLLIFTILIMGAYVLVMGIYKRKFSQAYSMVINYVLVFVMVVVFALGGETYTKQIHEVSNSVNQSVLQLGQNLVTSESGKKEGTPAQRVKDILFQVQVRNPWIMLQFGEPQISGNLEKRVKALEKLNPYDDEDKREDLVKKEVDKEGNRYLSGDKLPERLGMALIFLLVNTGITFFVSVLAVLLILAQVLFVFFSLFLPINFIVGLLPGKSQVAYKGIVSVFSYMFLQIGVSFILMITFSSSQLIFDLSAKTPLFFVMILQLVLFIGVYKNLGNIGEKLGGGEAIRKVDEKKRAVEKKVVHKAKEKGKMATRTVKAVATHGKSEVSRMVSEKSKGKNTGDLTRKANMIRNSEEKKIDKQLGKETSFYSMQRKMGMSEGYTKENEEKRQTMKTQKNSETEKKNPESKSKNTPEVTQMVKREGVDKKLPKEKKLSSMNQIYVNKEKEEVSKLPNVKENTLPEKKLSSRNKIYERKENLKDAKDTTSYGKKEMLKGKEKGLASINNVQTASSKSSNLVSREKSNHMNTKKE